MTQAAVNRPNRGQGAHEYKRDGYYIARQLVPKARMADVFADMHRLVTQQLERHGLPVSRGDAENDMHRDLKSLFNHDMKLYLATLTLCAKLTSLFELYLHPGIKAFAQSIGIALPVFQTAPVMHLMSHALKVPGGYQGYGAHQDWPTLQGSLDTVTVWLPFVDVDRNLFTMDIIPGSHNKALFPSTRTDNAFEVNKEHCDEKDFVPMETQLGDVVFMSCLAVHRSSLQGDDRLRVATSWRYENAAESHFIERGYPHSQKRVVARDLITPDFPSAEQVRRTFE